MRIETRDRRQQTVLCVQSEIRGAKGTTKHTGDTRGAHRRARRRNFPACGPTQRQRNTPRMRAPLIVVSAFSRWKSALRPTRVVCGFGFSPSGILPPSLRVSSLLITNLISLRTLNERLLLRRAISVLREVVALAILATRSNIIFDPQICRKITFSGYSPARYLGDNH